jgi:site-specific DNA recombinase
VTAIRPEGSSLNFENPRAAMLCSLQSPRPGNGSTTSFAVESLPSRTSPREAQGERHIRLLAPLAFVSPRIIAAIVDSTAPADLTVTGLAKTLPYSWAEQEQSSGLLQ